jgi:hypothetical protein
MGQSEKSLRAAWTRHLTGGAEGPGQNKYNAKKTEVNGRTFDSAAEAERAVELQWLLELGQITDLRYQVPFELIPDQDGERAVFYRADLVYRRVADDSMVIEDVKGFRTDAFRIKRKLMKFVHNLTIVEIGTSKPTRRRRR